MPQHPQHDEIHSTAAINGHPLHPAVIPFPIAFLVGALATDLAFMATGDTFWSRASLWLLIAGLAMGALAAILGLTDFLTRPRIRDHRIAWWHFGLNAAVLVLAGVNLAIRVMNADQQIVPTGLILSAVVAGLLTISGWLGGEMSYRHMIGVNTTEHTTEEETAEEAAHRRAYS